jgi:hypothetical protein
MNVLLAITEPVCPLCGHTWPRDPCFEVACPTCGANAGAYCKRPSGHSGPMVPFHAERDLAAAAAGAYAHPCVPDHRCTCCEATGAPLPVTLVAEMVQPPLF